MAGRQLSDQECAETLALYDEHGTETAAAAVAGVSRSTFQNRIRIARSRGIKTSPVPTAEPLPDDDIPTGEIIGLMRSRFQRRAANAAARQWREFRVPTDGPYAIMLFGDPHIDDDGCNWGLLERHCQLARDTRHLYAISVGDQTNNWVGRLTRLYAEQETSVKTARVLIKWLLVESGVPWFLWIHGNHDAWNEGIPIIEGMNANQIAMEDWQAKFVLKSPNGYGFRTWVAHNFPGTSQWNKLHGAQKAAQMKDWAHLYVAGHHHNWALHQEEHDHRSFVYWLARVRGYKFMDSYAGHLGFGEQEYGSSIVCVVDPHANKLNALTCFADPYEGADFLRFKRRKTAA